MADVLTSIIIAIAIPLVFWWLARKYPAPQLSSEGPTLEELWPKYRKWEWIFIVAYFAMWFPVAAAIYAPLHVFARWRAAHAQETADTLVFFMDGAILWLPAFFMSLLVSGVVLTPVFKAILRDRYVEYERYQALRFGMDQNRLLKGFARIMSVAFVLSVLLLFDAYVVASPRDLRVNTFLGLERRYAYDQISEVVTAPALIAPNGNTVHRRVYLLKFADGTKYSLNNMPEHEIRDRSPLDLARFILECSGLEAKEKAVFERGEL